MISLCNSWEFTEVWSEEFLAGGGTAERVRLPHNVRPLPLHYASPADYELICGYRRTLRLGREYEGKRLFLRFDGAAHQAQIYINGKPAASHRCGYTSFTVEITKLVRLDEENTIAVRLDCHEDGSIPPFGFVIDYLTYGGLYREVWLEVHEQDYIADVFASTPTVDSLRLEVKIDGKPQSVLAELLDGDVLLAALRGQDVLELKGLLTEVWSPDSPKLYTCRVTMDNGERVTLPVGFRTVKFDANGLLLNGERFFMRGLNRHQSFPYIGYAATEHLQREDARILRHELGCNAVRTSHYPQSHYFIDQCDREGLLVFTELPGWQHIGDEDWKEQALENLKELVLQYRNHPSIILWGVRINESADDDKFYKRANALAHELDPSRPTSGVRFIEKSHLLEDVYAYNDFSHSGANPGVKPKRKVTPDKSKALIITEHNGHMFPTKSFDPWEKRLEHALRHARVLSDAASDREHGGCFGWCMFDYATHKDFGSGDRICYHGVMDSFRNPKLAAALYASQSEEGGVLELGCPMDIGDYPGGDRGRIFAFTNADEISLYKNDALVASFKPTKDYPGLPHPPILIDDTIGSLLETQEGFKANKAAALRRCLISAGKHGLANMPFGDKARMLWCMLRYRMKLADGVALYGKYISGWGGEATRWRFDARKEGKVIASQTRCPGNRLRIEARASQSVLVEGASYDMAAVRIRIVDEYLNTACYAQLPLLLETEGCIELLSPTAVTAEGGMSGCYVRSVGVSGTGTLRLSSPGLDTLSLDFTVICEENEAPIPATEITQEEITPDTLDECPEEAAEAELPAGDIAESPDAAETSEDATTVEVQEESPVEVVEDKSLEAPAAPDGAPAATEPDEAEAESAVTPESAAQSESAESEDENVSS